MKRFVLTAMLVAATSANAQPYRVYGIGGKSIANWHGQADVTSLALEFDRPLTRATEVGFVVAPFQFGQPSAWTGEGHESAYAVAGALLVRHSFRLDSPLLQPYVEASTGPMWAERRVPAATSRFNFVSQGGAGFMIRPRSAIAFIAGYRFMHVSNGGYSPRNPGWNINAVVVGVRVRR
jgi:opacity protein-like surface antigen